MSRIGSISAGLAVAATAMMACIGDAEVVAPDERDALFDLAGFVAYQDSVLSGVGVRKTVRVGDTEEVQVIEDVDWAAELAPFAGANVNKPALTDAYAREVTEDGGASTILLTALDSAERVRLVRIVCEGAAEDFDCPYGDVSAVDVETRFESVIADTEQRLRWTRAGYEVVNRQRVVGREERVLAIRGEVEK